MEHKKVLIIITQSQGNGYARAVFAFKLGMTFINTGVDTTIYLAATGSILAREASTGKKDPLADNMRAYINDFMSSQGKLLVCCTCYMEQCGIKDRNDVEKTLIKGIGCGGMTAMAELSLESKVFTF